MRSTAAILAETEDIEPEWRARFHANLHDDSERLAAGAEALVAYLDALGRGRTQGVASPQEEVEAWLAGRGWHLAALEAGARPGALDAEVARWPRGRRGRWRAAGCAGGGAMWRRCRWRAFAAALAEIGPDPVRLAARFGRRCAGGVPRAWRCCRGRRRGW